MLPDESLQLPWVLASFAATIAWRWGSVMPRSGRWKVHRYGDEFRLTAVGLSQQPRIQVQPSPPHVESTARSLTVGIGWRRPSITD